MSDGAMLGISVRWRRAMACGAAIVMIILCAGLACARVVFAPRPPPAPSHDVSEGLHRELVLVHAVSRHGERTPADTFSTDPHINETFYPYGWGSLTNTGRMQMYKLGVQLRARYNGFLGDTYNERATYAQSTGSSRTRMSCALTLAGLWPPAGSPLDWNPVLDWQPIPVVSQELEEDMLLLVRKPCPRYYEALEEVLNSTDMRAELHKNSKLMRELSELSGMTVESYDDVQSLYSTLRAEDAMGLKLVEWSKQYYPEKLYSLTSKSFIVNTFTDELIRLKGGVLLKKLTTDWSAVTLGELRPRLTVYNGHDSTVANLGRALGVWDPQVPDYGITLMLELYRDTLNGQHLLEVYLKNSTRVEPYQLTIPGCESSCPIEKVFSLRQHVLPVDWQRECIPHDTSYEPPPLSGP